MSDENDNHFSEVSDLEDMEYKEEHKDDLSSDVTVFKVFNGEREGLRR